MEYGFRAGWFESSALILAGNTLPWISTQFWASAEHSITTPLAIPPANPLTKRTVDKANYLPIVATALFDIPSIRP